VVTKGLRLFTIDATAVARAAGLGGRINTVMQACFFHLAGVLPPERADEELKDAIRKTYGLKGSMIVKRNVDAIDHSLANLHEVPVPVAVTSTHRLRAVVPEHAPDFVQRVTARMMAGEGDLLPVSAMPVDGNFPTGTAQYEKRTIAIEIPIWEPDICIECGKCAIVCPHAAIRMKAFTPETIESAPEGFLSRQFRSREVPGMKMTIQVAPDDCTGCGVCVATCPAHDKSEVKRKSINMRPIEEHLEVERARFKTFLELPAADPAQWDPGTVKTSQLRTPLFEFSGACAGCGETPYIKLLTQLYGDRLLVANATGCSSIYGGNLPTTPYTTNDEGRGPAWSNSLFEDNAEFGLGIRLAYESQRRAALDLMARLGDRIDAELAGEIALHLDDGDDAGIAAQRARVAQLREALTALGNEPDALRLADVAGALVRKSTWIIGGDGWAYDIGYGGLDHVLGSGRNVNVLVLDTEVYSNTGGQSSKATPRGAVAKFASSGKGLLKKDLGLEAMSYGDVYIAKVSMGANELQTVRAIQEAEAWPGPSLVIAYSSCIAHGFDMSKSMEHQKLAVTSGHWPLWRYKPDGGESGKPFQLDSKVPSAPYNDFAMSEARFAMLTRSNPQRAKKLLQQAQVDVDERWKYYSQLAGVEREAPLPDPGDVDGGRFDDDSEE
jgi:pyruvate-ferredoxin/flavodoxin oxidoreductase